MLTWAVLDYQRRPKAGYEALRLAFQPLLPSIDLRREHALPGGEIQAGVLGTEQVNEFVVDDFNDLLAGLDTLDDFSADGLGFDAFDEIAGDLEIDVGFEQGHADFAQGFVPAIVVGADLDFDLPNVAAGHVGIQDVGDILDLRC